jgi:hypothetical protein
VAGCVSTNGSTRWVHHPENPHNNLSTEPAAFLSRQGMQIQRVDMEELRRIMRRGEMLLPALSTCHLALEELRLRGLLA